MLHCLECDILCIHLSVDGHLGPCVLVLVNKIAAVNISV